VWRVLLAVREHIAAPAPEPTAAARAAQAAGLGVNAGHDLNLHNLPPFLAAVHDVLEVSIGHALVADALDQGLAATVRNYLSAIAKGEGAA
jgi:pyridoxine 5-phosphate synthase